MGSSGSKIETSLHARFPHATSSTASPVQEKPLAAAPTAKPSEQVKGAENAPSTSARKVVADFRDLFEDWEIGPSDPVTGERDTTLYAYPIAPSPGQPEPEDDAEVMWAVGNQDRRVVGVIYHPEENPEGWARAEWRPLSKEGRADKLRYMDFALTSRATWPMRGGC